VLEVLVIQLIGTIVTFLILWHINERTRRQGRPTATTGELILTSLLWLYVVGNMWASFSTPWEGKDKTP